MHFLGITMIPMGVCLSFRVIFMQVLAIISCSVFRFSGEARVFQD